MNFEEDCGLKTHLEQLQEEFDQEAAERDYDSMQEIPKTALTKKEAWEHAQLSVDKLLHSKNAFKTLSQINVNDNTEKKGKFTYLSWAWAVTELLKHFPEAVWGVRKFDGIPYLKTDTGYYVETWVRIGGLTRTHIHPVLDNYNRPIEKPSSFQINTSQQRCLAMTIALHGLGLYIYAGEDLPEVESEKDSLKRKYYTLLKDKYNGDIPAGLIENAKAMNINEFKLGIKNLENE